jgi:hypothetical protein
VPFLILGAIWLWKRQPWGYVLAAILCVKGTVYMLALVALSTAAMTADFRSVSGELPLWGLLSLGFLAASLSLVGNVKSAQGKEPLIAREKMFDA